MESSLMMGIRGSAVGGVGVHDPAATLASSLSRGYLRPMYRHWVCLIGASIALISTGCREESVRAYRAPKDDAPEAKRPASAGTAQKPPWTVPDGWAEKPSTSTTGSRIASYTLSGQQGAAAEVAVSALAGTGGGALENVNLWRNQIGLAAVTQEELGKLSKVVRIGSREAVSYELIGERAMPESTQTNRTLVAIMPAGEMTVFFKLTGEQALVAENRTKFVEWLKSVNTGSDSEEETRAETSRPPVSSSPVPSASSPSAGGDATGLPQWTVPPGWKREGERPMRLASFSIPGDAGGRAADLSISTLGGAGGGLLSNINRWRGQLGLASWVEADLKTETQSVEIGGVPATVVDFAGEKSLQGEERKTRILGAVIPRGNQTWFFKLTGDDAVVARERENFMGFVKSIRY